MKTVIFFFRRGNSKISYCSVVFCPWGYLIKGFFFNSKVLECPEVPQSQQFISCWWPIILLFHPLEGANLENADGNLENTMTVLIVRLFPKIQLWQFSGKTFFVWQELPLQKKTVGVASSSVSVQLTLHLSEPLNQCKDPSKGKVQVLHQKAIKGNKMGALIILQ